MLNTQYTKIRELIQKLGQINIGEGTLVATNQRVAQAIEMPVEQLENWVKTEQPNVHVDETPWAVKGIKDKFNQMPRIGQQGNW